MIQCMIELESSMFHQSTDYDVADDDVDESKIGNEHLMPCHYLTV